jgi:hypothetical protein
LVTDILIINESLINSDAIKFNKKDIESYNNSLMKENMNESVVMKEEKDYFLLKFTSIFVVQNDYKYRTLKVKIINLMFLLI